MDASEALLPLADVAEDQRPLIRAFREAGEISFQTVPLAEARANYDLTGAANGLQTEPLATVRDHSIEVPGDTPGGRIAIREYRPSAGRLPAILFLHGGGWVIGGLASHDPLCRFLAQASGAAVFAVDYRLAPEHPFPTPLEDAEAGLRWLRDQAETLDIDAGRIALAGDSAGGNLAAVLANTSATEPAAVVLLYPVTDLRGATWGRLTRGVPLSVRSMEWFRGHYAGEADLSDPRLSPLLAADPSRAPHFIVTCGHDPLAEEGVAYAGRLALHGAEVEHHHLPRHAHGLFTAAGKVATGRRLAEAAGIFLADRLGGGAG
ncbi:alpha/beta hydrolase [Haematobacter genomosp. 1]|uniref:Alpha/beta hydrolase n=1 Tax=Haematobacter genomosp. 1 TaxID=366618 RepID=A0A212AAL8_9RHOB|nr:alpha/beta hydrolase [Haematobacter genomosp. 1]OWJ77264.1 alpha/beta hydrolase [Haematobacter genomosp. 1]